MYSLRVTPKGKTLIEECADICGIKASKVLRVVAFWIKNGRIKIADGGTDTVEVTKKRGKVIKINVEENYYKNVSEIITAEMPAPPTVSQRDFRIMVIAACIDVITDYREKYARLQEINRQHRAGVDYNVPDRILELKTLAAAGQRSVAFWIKNGRIKIADGGADTVEVTKKRGVKNG